MNQIWCKANWMRIIANFMQKHNQLHSIPKICFESSYLSHATFECEWNSDSETLVQSSMYQSLSGVFSSPAKSMVLYSVPHKFISNCLFCLTFASFILLSVGQLPHYSLSHLFFFPRALQICANAFCWGWNLCELVFSSDFGQFPCAFINNNS